ncbi:peroxisome assembly protein 26-like [Liolophura sinensis]|uniref:peroxisome assembly protein 26-like n=1 Tax=Liolophura sinensis TaxID=3198878 RepID=UPI00315805A6
MLDKNCVENDITACIDRATDFLLLKDFEKCAFECIKGLIIAKQQADEESVNRASEMLCVLWIQAYAELDRWREVLPFITQEYQGIEGCPVKVVQLLVLLHAKVEEFAQCHAIASIWLKTDQSVKDVEGYAVLAETYLTHVLARQKKWQEMGAFLKSCTSLSSEEMTRLTQLSELLKITEEDTSSRKEREIKDLVQRLKKRSQTQQCNTHSRKNAISEVGTESDCSRGNHRRIVTFVHGLGLYVSRGLRYINLKVIYKLIFVGMFVYLITIQANVGDLISNTTRIGQVGEALKKVLVSLLWPRHQH